LLSSQKLLVFTISAPHVNEQVDAMIAPETSVNEEVDATKKVSSAPSSTSGAMEGFKKKAKVEPNKVG
jgi:hypothetical protein